MERYFEANKRRWNELVGIHQRSDGYDVEGFLKGGSSLHEPELEALPDVAGKSLLHLQCYFGLDTLSWTRRGARVTGVDFSETAIELARMVAGKAGLEAEFINCNLYELPEHLEGQFDFVYTSYGVLCWLPDIDGWARIVSRYLKPGGVFFIAEFHPFAWVFDEDHPEGLHLKYSYWHRDEPDHYVSPYTYESEERVTNQDSYEWTHPLGSVINALIKAGLAVTDVKEYPYTIYPQFKFAKKSDDGKWRINGNLIPLLFSVKAVKPA